MEYRNTEEGTVALRVLNPGRQKCVLRCGLTAGHLTSVDDKDIEESHQVFVVVGKEVQVPGHLWDLFNRATEELEPCHHATVAQLLIDYAVVFSKGDDDIGKTGLVKHCMDTGIAHHIRERPRRQPACNQRLASK